MVDNTNKVTIDVKTHLKMAMPICEIEGFAKGCEIAFPEAANAFKEISGKARALLEAWYALEKSADEKELRFNNPPQFLWVKIDALTKECDDLKAKLATSQNYEDVIAAKDREIAAVKEERNRLNAKVNELLNDLKQERMNKCDEVTAPATAVEKEAVFRIVEKLAELGKFMGERIKWVKP